MAFDALGALNAGYTFDQINPYLAKEKNFDLEAARKAGYSDDQIFNFLHSLPEPEAGFIPSVKGGWSKLKEDFSQLAGRTGVISPEEAEKYAKEQQLYRQQTVKPVEGGWKESPWGKFKETLGESLPAMAAPLVAAGAAAALPEELAGAAILGGITTLGRVAPAVASFIPAYAQRTASNVAAQKEAGTPLMETSLAGAAATAAPQAVIDVAANYAMPGLRKLLRVGGKSVSEKTLEEMAKAGTANILKDYAGSTAEAIGVQGAAQAAQTFLTRMQAGLSLTDEQARDQYWDSVISGAAIGGALAPFGRAYERYGEKKQAEKRQADLRTLDEQIAAKRQEEAAAAEAEELASKQRTPEYRQNLADEIAAFQQQLDIVGPLSKDKSQPKDVRQEARQRMQSLKNEIATRAKELRSIKEQIGAIPTVEQSLQEQGYVVDDYGRLVKPDGKEATEEEYAKYLSELDKKRANEALIAKLQAAEAERVRQQQAAEEDLRNKQQALQGQAELEGRGTVAGMRDLLQERDNVVLQKQWQDLLEQRDNAQAAFDEVGNIVDERAKARREQQEKQLTEDMALNRIQSRLNTHGLLAAGIVEAPKIRELKDQITALGDPSALAKLSFDQRRAQIAQVQDLQVQLEQAKAKAPAASRQGIERAIDQGIVNQNVAAALGIKGLEKRTVDATDAVPHIEARIQELEDARQALTENAKTLINENGTLTKQGHTLVANEAKLRELRRLQDIAAQKTQTSPAEQRLEGSLVETGRGISSGQIPVEEGKGTNFYKGRAKEAADARTTSLLDMTELMDSFRKGAVAADRARGVEPEAKALPLQSSEEERTLLKVNKDRYAKLFDNLRTAEDRQKQIALIDKAKEFARSRNEIELLQRVLRRVRESEQLEGASMTEQSLVADADRLRGDVLNKAIDEVANRRAAGALHPVEKPSFLKPNVSEITEQEAVPMRLLTSHEALQMRTELNTLLQQYFKQSTALPKNHPNALITRMVEPAQMRGTKLVSPAKYETIDPRSITELPFQDHAAAAKQLADAIQSKIDEYTSYGQRTIGAERTFLKKTPEGGPIAGQKFGSVEVKAGTEPATDLLKDIDQVRRMPGLKEDVSALLDEAQTRIAEDRASPELTALVKEQVGRILRGTDRPFELERDVTKRGRKEEIAGAGTAELADEIRTQMRTEDEARGRYDKKGDVNKDLFPETLAIERKTPKTWERYVGSKEVEKLREAAKAARSAEEKARIEQELKIRNDAEKAHRALDEAVAKGGEDLEGALLEYRNKAADIHSVKDAHAFIERQMQEKLKRTNKASLEEIEKKREAAAVEKETSPETQYAEQLETVKKLHEEIFKEKKLELATAQQELETTLKQLEKDRRNIESAKNTLSPDAMNKKLQEVQEKKAAAAKEFEAKYEELLKKDAAEMTRLDGRMQLEFKHLKALEKRVQEAKKGSPEQRAARAAAQKIRGELVKAERALTERKNARSKAIRQAQERIAQLPTTVVTMERLVAGKQQRVATRKRVIDVVPRTSIVSKELVETPKNWRETKKALKEGPFQTVETTIEAEPKKTAATEAARENIEYYRGLAERGVKALSKKRDEARQQLIELTHKLSKTSNPKEVAALIVEQKATEQTIATIGKEIAGLNRAKKKNATAIQEALRIGTSTKQQEVAPRRKFVSDLRTGVSDEDVLAAKAKGKGRGRKQQTLFEDITDIEGEAPKDIDQAFRQAMADYQRNGGTDFRVNTEVMGGIDQAAADARAAEIAKSLPEGAPFKYYSNAEALPDAIKQDTVRQGLADNIEAIRGGVTPDGEVFVIGAHHADLMDMEKTIAHEFIGHHGFEGVVGKEGMNGLLQRVDKNLGGVFKLADKLGVSEEAQAAYLAGKRMGMTDEQARVKALKETIAYTTEQQVSASFMQKAGTWLKEMVGALRASLRKLGLVDAANLSTNDLYYMIKQARENFEEGRPVAYKNADGDVLFAQTKAVYPENAKAVGDIADKLIGEDSIGFQKLKASVTGLAGRVAYLDRHAALDHLLKIGVDKKLVDSLAAADTAYMARMVDQLYSYTGASVTKGAPALERIKRPDGNYEKMILTGTTASIKDVSAALAESGIKDAKAVGNLFTLYLAAERAASLKGGLDVLNYSGKITQAELNQALQYGRSNPAFQKARKLYNEYNKGLVEFANQAGALTKEEYAAMSKAKDYVPYYRIVDGVAQLYIGSEHPVRIGDITSQPYLKELVGGDEKIKDFFTSSIQNTTLLIDKSLKNLATYHAVNSLKDMGIATVRPGTGPAGKDILRFTHNGEKYHAKLDVEAKKKVFGDIPSELIVTGMEGIKTSMGLGTRILRIPANLLRKCVTRNPKYVVNQIVRDSLTAAITTGTDIKPVVSTLSALKDTFEHKQDTFGRSGLMGGQVLTGTSSDMKTILQQLSVGKKSLWGVLAKLDEIAMMGDHATRRAIYLDGLRQGLSEREAVMTALESMNFGRHGVSPELHKLNMVIPFLNSGLQGLDVAYRAFKNEMPYTDKLRVRNKLLVRGTMLAAGTMAYAAMMKNNKSYQNANPEERTGNWFIPLPGTDETLRVPIPFEMGLIFKTIPEAIVNMAQGEDAKKILKGVGMQALQTLPGNLGEGGPIVPAAAKPILETMINKSFFTGRDIVGAKEAELEPQFQYTDKTTEAAKSVGAMLNVSPMKVEHLINGYTGAVGLSLLSVLNPMIRPMRYEAGERGAVEGRLSDMPLVGKMFQPSDASGVINEAYESMKEVQSKQASYKRLIDEGHPKEAAQYIKDNVTDLNAASLAGYFKQEMGQLTKAENAIKAAPASQMSPEEKRKRLDTLRDQKIKLSKIMITARTEITRQTAH